MGGSINLGLFPTMRILRENTIADLHVPSSVRRVTSIVVGLVFGVMLGVASVSGTSPVASIVSEPVPAKLAASRPQIESKTESSKPKDWHQVGLASWYGPEFQGKETANGETFNMHELTCAHRTLPLGTWVKVTNLHTHRWIVARVNDRGPVPDTRIADLSAGAARMLGIRSRGVSRIRLDVIDPKQSVEIARMEKVRMARLAAQSQSDQIDLGD